MAITAEERKKQIHELFISAEKELLYDLHLSDPNETDYGVYTENAEPKALFCAMVTEVTKASSWSGHMAVTSELIGNTIHEGLEKSFLIYDYLHTFLKTALDTPERHRDPRYMSHKGGFEDI